MLHPVPVVRLIISDAAGRVLVLKRQKSQYSPGAWCLPGGKIRYGETVEQAIVRELQEETSLKCTSWRHFLCQDSLPPEQGKMHCINLYFVCDVSGEIELNEESEFDSCSAEIRLKRSVEGDIDPALRGHILGEYADSVGFLSTG